MTASTAEKRSAVIDQTTIEQFLYREARYLDDREFEKWLTCYADDVEYWMPSWGDDDLLTEDPQTDISLIYYENKGGLEDRVFRIRTNGPAPHRFRNLGQATTSTTSRSSSAAATIVDVRFNWHTMYFRYKTIDQTATAPRSTRSTSPGRPRLIRRKTVVLKNDYIHHVVDIYHF